MQRSGIAWRRVRLLVGVLTLTMTASGCTLWGWGSNEALGEEGEPPLAPLQIGASSEWAAVSHGFPSACGIRTDGTLWCWGSSNYGQIGDGTKNPHYVPVRIGTATWRSVSVYAAHTCGIQSDDSLWCWGYNGSGELGDGTTEDRLSPIPIGTAAWKSIEAGGPHTCGIQADDSLWCWGGATGRVNSATVRPKTG